MILAMQLGCFSPSPFKDHRISGFGGHDLLVLIHGPLKHHLALVDGPLAEAGNVTVDLLARLRLCVSLEGQLARHDAVRLDDGLAVGRHLLDKEVVKVLWKLRLVQLESLCTQVHRHRAVGPFDDPRVGNPLAIRAKLPADGRVRETCGVVFGVLFPLGRINHDVLRLLDIVELGVGCTKIESSAGGNATAHARVTTIPCLSLFP